MKKQRLVFLFLLQILVVAAFGQERFMFRGRVVDFITYQPLSNTCIHNLSSGLMTFSGTSGDFSMLMRSTDTLAVSRVGYDMELFTLSDSLYDTKQRITFRLIMRSIMLREVVIYALKPYPMFVQDLAKATPQKKVEIPGVEISAEERANYDINAGNLLRGTPLASPISFLYDKFSYKAKMNRMYAGLMENQEEAVRLSQKYNPEIVHRITKFEGERLEDFMLYCSFTYYTLVTSTDVEIEKMIADKYLQYKRENGIW
ncbi:MAG: hypothetical protein LBH82_00320 [Bacteroidales bacterium]|jgi:hypothetical protein|nr:hypothetical protein [Bacteroidales bacterium]